MAECFQMIKVKAKKSLTTGTGPMQLDIDVEIKETGISALFGPSGVGKTTVLRMIAGLTNPDEGLIQVNGDVWFDSSRKINKPVQERQIGFVFQDYNLFPNMTVRENLQYALKNKKASFLIDEFLEMAALTELADRKPLHLSGGQKQRVALVRTLLNKPQLFLLDEPFSALDLDMRLRLQDEFLSISNRFEIPTIFVSHDISEVFKLSRRVFVMKDGKIVRSGPPAEAFGTAGATPGIKLVGIVLSVQNEDSKRVAMLQIGNEITKVCLATEDARCWRTGDRVLLSAQAHDFSLVVIGKT